MSWRFKMPSKRLSRKDFDMLLLALSDSGPEVKYQNPDAWRGYYLLK